MPPITSVVTLINRAWAGFCDRANIATRFPLLHREKGFLCLSLSFSRSWFTGIRELNFFDKCFHHTCFHVSVNIAFIQISAELSDDLSRISAFLARHAQNDTVLSPYNLAALYQLWVYSVRQSNAVQDTCFSDQLTYRHLQLILSHLTLRLNEAATSGNAGNLRIYRSVHNR